MATLREIRSRISGVKNTQKITKAMKMVAAAKLRRAQSAIMAARPYAKKMGEMLRNLASQVDPGTNPLLQHRELQRVLVVVVTADRGMCGAFNGNIIKAAIEHIQRNYSAQRGKRRGVQLMMVGKKGLDNFKKRDYEIVSKHVGLFASLDFPYARDIVREMKAGYLNGEFDRVEVIYNEFKSVIQQRIRVEQFLPILPDSPTEVEAPTAAPDYIYEPSMEAILEELLPKHLNFQMWRVLLESNAAEQGARMTAMGNATENAKDLIRLLTLSYNKARQAGITKELLEIVSGAEALKKSG